MAGKGCGCRGITKAQASFANQPGAVGWLAGWRWRAVGGVTGSIGRGMVFPSVHTAQYPTVWRLGGIRGDPGGRGWLGDQGVCEGPEVRKKKIRLELWRDNGIRARMSAPMFCFVVDKRVLSNLTCGRRVLTSQVSAGLLRPARQGPWLAGSAAQQAKLGSRYEGDLVGPLRCYSVCPGTAKSPVVGVESIHLLC